MEPTLPRPRLRRDVMGDALICAGSPHLRIRLCRSVLWLTSWSTVSAASPSEALSALGRRSFRAVLVELSAPFVHELAPQLAWQHDAAHARPFVIGVDSEQDGPRVDEAAVPSGFLDARLGVNYGPRAFGALFADHEPELTLARLDATRAPDARALLTRLSRGVP